MGDAAWRAHLQKGTTNEPPRVHQSAPLKAGERNPIVCVSAL
jgi:hypothetical protein